MNKLLSFTMAAIATLAAGAAHADDAYAGASIINKGHATLRFDDGRQFENHNSPRTFKLYGGIGITDHFAFEAGHANFGSYAFVNPSTGTGPGPLVESNLIYAAAKGTLALGEAFSLFAKIGAARHRLEVAGLTPEPLVTAKVRPMIGVGAEYRITGQLSFAAELVDYGKVKDTLGGLNQRRAEAGFKYSF